MKKIILAFLLAAMLVSPAAAQTILYIPADNRPVSFSDVADTARAAGVDILVPPESALGNRTQPGAPDELWSWLLEHGPEADAIVVSGDSLLYGSLVASRTHHTPQAVLQERLANFAALREHNPALRIYIYNTIMRTPQASAGGVEPPYYETYGPSIFRLTALQDKQELQPLSRREAAELKKLEATLPAEALADWFDRRNKNYAANARLIGYVREGLVDYLILGRDDCSPLSQSHKESRHLSQEAAGLPASRYASFPGADQLGMVLLTRAINDYNFQIPIVRVLYAPGAGGQTIPTYEDVPFSQTIFAHLAAAGGVPLATAKPDLYLAVNTPENGITREANTPANQSRPGKALLAFVDMVEQKLEAGERVAVADIAFANGADNALMNELARRGLLYRLESYSGWNTASNTLGYTIGQGMLAPAMSPRAKNDLLSVRFLDDWAYQSNIRQEVAAQILYPQGGSYFRLDGLSGQLTDETERRIRQFADTRLADHRPGSLRVSFPWNRMFEVKVEVK
ncbi:MAG TPA: DUF4127 family protein [Selenomonadales bacterium]|nr:DUF4127 family protein [Selenomonadales bacterium]